MKRSQWRAQLGACRIDSTIRSWLTETGSLTARCQRASRAFGVRLLHYGKGRALSDESVEGESGRAPAWVREVALVCDGVPVIFAHTTLSTARNGRLGRWMARLGNRSLGSLLFAHPGFRRGRIEYLRLDARHPLFRRAAALGEIGASVWARRSLHRLDGQQVLVTEVFLPTLAELEKR